MSEKQYNEMRIKEALTAYHMGEEDTTMTLHKIAVIVGHKMPSTWSFEDYRQGRLDNGIPLTA